MDTPELQDNLLLANVVGVDLKKTSFLFVFFLKRPYHQHLIKKWLPAIIVTKTLSPFCETKIVCQLIIKSTKEVATYTCFNDEIHCLLKNINCSKTLEEIETLELQKLLLKAGMQ